MQVAGGRRSRSSKSPHCSINKNKQRERRGKKKENEGEIVWTNHWKKNKMAVMDRWLLPSPACFLLTF